ncbi:unnamed protein product [Amoebophrya sp. A25]|nr:unnamed protein product [Amoebophrya sp. A25]|eukprot:GSA25T00019539001.1
MGKPAAQDALTRSTSTRSTVAIFYSVGFVSLCALFYLFRSVLPPLSSAKGCEAIVEEGFVRFLVASKIPEGREMAAYKCAVEYKAQHEAYIYLAYCTLYVTMMAFVIPGTVVLTFLAGALFSFLKAQVLVASCATVGATAGFLISKYIGSAFLNFFNLDVTPIRNKLYGEQSGEQKVENKNKSGGSISSPRLKKSSTLSMASRRKSRNKSVVGSRGSSSSSVAAKKSPKSAVLEPTATPTSSKRTSTSRSTPSCSGPPSWFKVTTTMTLLRVTPFPSLLINVGAPHVGVPVSVFFVSTLFGLLPLNTIQILSGRALAQAGELDKGPIAALMCCGSVIFALFYYFSKEKKSSAGALAEDEKGDGGQKGSSKMKRWS